MYGMVHEKTCVYIAHYIAKIVEEEKKGRKPRPNKLYTPTEHKQTNTK